METWPIVIIGPGVAGLGASIYSGQGLVPHVVLEGDNPGGALLQSYSVRNWPGIIDIPGHVLVDKQRRHAEQSGGKFLPEAAVKVDFSRREPSAPGLLRIWTPNRLLLAHVCIIATGSVNRVLGVPGEEQFLNKGIYWCPTCEGTRVLGDVVAVIGGSDSAIARARYLAPMTKKVYMIVRGQELKSKDAARKEQLLQMPNVTMLFETKVVRFEGAAPTPGGGKNAKLSHLVLEPTEPALERIEKRGRLRPAQRELAVDSVFLAVGADPNTALFKDQLQLNQDGSILLGKHQETSVSGVYAAGDVSDREFMQAITASAEGAKAAIQAKDFIGALHLGRPLSSFPIIHRRPASEVKTLKAAGALRSEPQLPRPVVQSIRGGEDWNKFWTASGPRALLEIGREGCSACKHVYSLMDAMTRDPRYSDVKFGVLYVDTCKPGLRKEAMKLLPGDKVPLVIAIHNSGIFDQRVGSQSSDDLRRLIDSIPLPLPQVAADAGVPQDSDPEMVECDSPQPYE